MPAHFDRLLWTVGAVLLGGLAVLAPLRDSLLRADDQPTPIKDLADRLLKSVNPRSPAAHEKWAVDEFDSEPRVEVEGYRGYRLVLKRALKAYESTGQRVESPAEREARNAPFEVRTEIWEFVLFPVAPRPAPKSIASKIEWRKSNSRLHTRDVCLGTDSGYTWFTHGTIFGQERVRDSFNFKGGDDRIQLAMDGLFVEDYGSMTRNSCAGIPARFGDDALPHVEKAVARASDADELLRVIHVLSHIRTARSTELLLKWFDSGDEARKRAVRYALVFPPYRQEAKRVYLDILRQQRSVESAAKACLQFQWDEAVPILKEQIARPRDLHDVGAMIRARRMLEGRPVPDEFSEIEQTLRGRSGPNGDAELEKQIESAIQMLIQTEDSEAANITALALVIGPGKGGAGIVNRRGLRIFKDRPRETTLPFLKTLAAGVDDGDRPRVTALLEAVSGMGVPGIP